MQNPRRLAIFGSVLKPEAVWEGAFQNRYYNLDFFLLVNGCSVGTTVFMIIDDLSCINYY